MRKTQWLRAAGLLTFANEGGEGGGDGGGDDAAAAAAAASAAGTPAELAARAATQKTADDAAAAASKGDKGGDDSPWADPDKAKREIERLRRENGDARINAKTAAAEEARKEMLATLTKALDPNASGDEPTIESLTSLLDAAKGDGTSAKIESAVVREAWAAGVDPKRVEYLQFVLGKRADFKSVDAASADLGATLKTMISEEIGNDSSLKATGAQQTTGDSQFGGADSGTKQYTLTEFKAMSMQQRQELYRANRAEYDRLTNS